MNLLLWFLAGLLILIGIIGLGLSFYLARRFGQERGARPSLTVWPAKR